LLLRGCNGKLPHNILKGIYTLVIKLHKPQTITIGKMGSISFSAGYYAYVGSALNGLEGRIKRHLKQEKRLHWHVDYFLCESKVVEIVYGLTERKKECTLASQLAGKMTYVAGFGCSDCSCKSHLFYFKDFYQVRKIVRNSFMKCGLKPRVWE
jgi:Uri superfamily endonuclease